GTVVADGAAQDHGTHAVAVGQGSAQWLEDDDADSVGRGEPVGGRVAELAATVGCEHPDLGQQHVFVRRELEVDARGDGQLRLSGTQTLAREVDGHQRRGARRDRKSTRLNSSHVKISYAVFCLKKKKVRR